MAIKRRKLPRKLRRKHARAKLTANLLANAFCPTGPGGGIDPTCSPPGTSAGPTSDFRIANKDPSHTGKELQAGTMDFLREVRRVAGAFHKAGFKIMSHPTRRGRIYKKALEGLGLRLVDPAAGVWNVALLATNAAAPRTLPTRLSADTRRRLAKIRARVGQLMPTLGDAHGMLFLYLLDDLKRYNLLTGLVANAGPTLKSQADSLYEISDEYTRRQVRDIARIVRDGHGKGWSDAKVAKELFARVDDLDEEQAGVLATTEGTRLRAAEVLGRASGFVRFKQGGDACPICAALDGQLFTVEEAGEVIPVHPNCTCEWELAEEEDVTENVFCPTGAGGGVDPTCSPGEGGSGGGASGDYLKQAKMATGAGVADLVSQNPGKASFSDLDLEKIKYLNPEGVKDGKLIIGKIHQNAQTKAAEEAKETGKHLQSEQIKALQELLPPGTQIVVQHVTAKQMFGEKPVKTPAPVEDKPTSVQTQPVSPSPASGASHLHSADSLASFVASNQGNAKFTELELEKIKHLNPEGVKNGVFILGKVPQNAATVAAEEAKGTGIHTQKAQIEALKQVLPPGTIIKTQHVTSKQLGVSGSKGDVSLTSQAPTTTTSGPKTKLPEPPSFLDPTYAAANTQAAQEMLKLAQAGNLKGLEAHLGTGSPKLGQYKQQLVDSLQPKPAAAPSAKHGDKDAGGVFATGEFNVKSAKGLSQAHKDWAKQMSQSELSAITSWKGSAADIRKSVAQNALHGTEVTETAKHFLSAIAKAPPYEGNLFRGIGSKDYANQIYNACKNAGVGGTWADLAPMGMSRHPKTSLGFSGGDLMLSVKVKTARPIEPGDGYTSEAEIIGMPGKQYRIKSITEKATIKAEGWSRTKRWIELEEI